MMSWDDIVRAIGASSMKELFMKARESGLDIVGILNDYLRSEPLFQLIGLEILEVGDGVVKARFPYKKEILRRGGVVTGGVIMTVIDSILGIAVMTVNDGVDQFTAELKVHFLEPLRDGPFTVDGHVIRAGRHLAVAEAEVRDANSKLCAKGIGTWFMVKEK